MIALADIDSCIISIVAYFAVCHKHKQVIQVDIKQERPQHRSLRYAYTSLYPRAIRTIYIYFLHKNHLHSSTLIDNIFSNITENEAISGNILTQITDHVPQFLIVKRAGMTYKNLSYFQHDLSKLNEESLLNDFANIDLTFLNDCALDVNAKFNRLLSILDELMNHTLH